MHIYFYSTKSCSEFIGFLVSCDGGAASLPYLSMLPKKVSPSSQLTQISGSYLIKNVVNLAIVPY